MVPQVTKALPPKTWCPLFPQEMLSESTVKLSCIDKAPSLSFSQQDYAGCLKVEFCQVFTSQHRQEMTCIGGVPKTP